MADLKHIYEIEIRATPERIWQALTDGSLTQKYFFGTRLDGELVEGRPYIYYYPDGSHVTEGTWLEIDPPRRLVMTWRFVYDAELAAEAPSRVTWEIEPRGESCTLRVTHDQLGPATSAHVSGGWSFVIASMKSLLETGVALERPKR
jgi:uncharacterized protein YndB with AHSA1/START domain